MNLLNLFAKLSLDSSEYEKGLDNANSEAKSFESTLKNGLVSAGKVAASAMAVLAAGVTAVAAGLTKAITATVAYGDTVDKTSQKMGLSAESYQEWDAVMRHAGTSIDSLQMGMRTLANAVESGNKAFERIGLTIDDISKMSNEELFSATITALQGIENQTERTYLAGQLLGRGATELGALLNMTAEETQALKDRVHEIGGVMSDEAVKASAKFKDSLQDLSTAASGIVRALGSRFLPGITAIMDEATDAIAGSNGVEGLIKSGFGIILKYLPQAVEKGTAIVLAIIDGIVDASPQILNSALLIIKTLASGLINALPQLVPALIQTVLEIVETLTSPDSIDMIIDAAIGLIMGLAEGLINAIPIVIEKLPIIIVNIVNALIKLAPKLVEAGITLIVKLNEGIIKATPQIIKEVFNLGKNLLSGLWDGFKSNIKSIGDKIKGFFTGIVDGVKNLLGIHSPSKVFAKMGENMALGISEGWSDEFGKVKKSIGEDLNFGSSSIGIAARYSGYGNVAEANFAARSGYSETDERGFVTTSGKTGTYNITLKIGEREFGRATWKANRDENQIVGLTLAPA